MTPLPRCPLCNQPTRTLAPGWERVRWQPMAHGGVVAQPGTTYTKSEPARTANLESDVVVPALQSIITGAFLGLAGFALPLLFSIDRAPAVGLATGGLSTFATWWWLLKDHNASLWIIEEVTGQDIDHDGYVGKPPERRLVTVEVKKRKGYLHYVDTPLTDDEWEDIAEAVLIDGVTFSRRKLADAGVLIQEHYPAVMEPMLRAGLLRRYGNGVELTPVGRSFLRQYLHPTDG